MRMFTGTLAMSMILLVVATASATTYTVKPDGTGDYSTIQAAIDACVNGDIVQLADGTFTGIGNRDIDYGGRAITVTSLSGDPTNCVIDCQGLGRGFVFHSGEDTTSVLEGVTITSGSATGSEADGSGGGAHLWQSSAMIRHCTFVNNTATTWGGGVGCFGSGGVTIIDCEFIDNTGGDWPAPGGGGIGLNYSNARIVASSFFNNTANRGGGVSCYESDAAIIDCSFADNSSGIGGGLYCFMGGASVTSCAFSGNTAGSGGGLFSDASTNLVDCRFSENSASEDGGAIWCWFQLDLSGCTLTNNSASRGGAIHCMNGVMTASNCTLAGNLAQDGGGISCGGVSDASIVLEATIVAFSTQGEGIYCEADCTPTLVCSDVVGNAGGDWVGCIADQYGVNGNIASDPFFCDPDNGDYGLPPSSPCLLSPCGQIGAWGQGCAFSPVPRILSISDVGNDQGGQVRIRWERSSFDAPGDSVTITGYGVYRRQEQFMTALCAEAAMTIEDPAVQRSPQLNGWDYIATVPARGDSVYQFVTPTLCDSTAADSICWSTFFVSAMTPDPLVYFDSMPDSGYSVDNLFPATPQGLAGYYDYLPDRLVLHWSPNQEGDLFGYRVYRGEGSDFVPTGATLIETSTDTLVSGLDYYPVEPWYIKVSAVDIHGNESGFAILPPWETPVATVVTNVHSALERTGVAVTWEITEGVPDLAFRVLRKVGPSGHYGVLVVDILREGNQFQFLDPSPVRGEVNTYRVVVIEEGSEIASVETRISVPNLAFALRQNYPNPFRHTTFFDYELPSDMDVELTIYDVNGRKVKTVIREDKKAGTYTQALGADGLAAGVYFYRLRAGNRTISKKMILMR